MYSPLIYYEFINHQQVHDYEFRIYSILRSNYFSYYIYYVIIKN